MGWVRAVPVFGSDGSSLERFFHYCFNRTGRFRFRFRFLKTVLMVPVPLSVSPKAVPAVRVSGSGSVLGHPG